MQKLFFTGRFLPADFCRPIFAERFFLYMEVNFNYFEL